MLGGVDAVDEGLARLDRDALLTEHGTGVDALVHEVDGDAGRCNAGGERVVDRERGINYYRFTITGRVAY